MKLSEREQRIANAVSILHHHGWTVAQVERLLDGLTREDAADEAERAAAAIPVEDCED